MRFVYENGWTAQPIGSTEDGSGFGGGYGYGHGYGDGYGSGAKGHA